MVSKRHKYETLLFLSSLLVLSQSIEEVEPEVYLQPRNFNPHPYELQREAPAPEPRGDTGPILFPPSPPDEDENVNQNIITIQRQQNRGGDHPVDYHPYPRVLKKQKFKLNGRFSNNDNQVNPRVYEGLANHAAKVLSKPPTQLGKDYTLSSLSDQRKDYAFSYKVVDHLTGDDFSHSQSQNSRATNGEYRVKLPDGRLQIVSYTADKNGYKADVKYMEDNSQPQNTQIQQIPVPNNQIKPLPQNTYDYQYDDIGVSNLQKELPVYDENPVIYTPVPARGGKIAPSYVVSPSPAPQLYAPPPKIYSKHSSHVIYPKVIPHENVQIYSNNYPLQQGYVSSTAPTYSQDNYVSISSTTASPIAHHQYISSTVAPFTVQSDYHGNSVSSTIAPILKYSLQTGRHPDEVYYAK